ncbi:MAG: anti-sigma factor antagonist [Clostridia bacterium]|nr:anti-sigma factor antagonist [Clostridia bacterium]
MENLIISYKDEVLTAKLLSEIDHHSAVNVREKIDSELYKQLPRTLIFDLSEVNFMDSSGLGLVLGRYSKAKEIGAEVNIKNPSKRTEKIFHMAGTDKLIKIIHDKEIKNETNK